MALWKKWKKKSRTSDGPRMSKSERKRALKSGNPAKRARAREEQSRAAANRVSRSAVRIKDGSSPRWYAPAMVTLLVVGLLWVVVTYLFGGLYPIPYFQEHHAADPLLNGNLYIGFLIMLVGFLGLLRWK